MCALVGAGAGAALPTGNGEGVVVPVKGAGAGTAVVKRGGAVANTAVTTSDPIVGAGVPVGAGDGGIVGAPGFRAAPLAIHLVWIGFPLAVGAVDGAGVVAIAVGRPGAGAGGGTPLATEGTAGGGGGAIARGGNGFTHGFGLPLGVGVQAVCCPAIVNTVALAIDGAGAAIFPSEGDFTRLSIARNHHGNGQSWNQKTNDSHGM